MSATRTRIARLTAASALVLGVGLSLGAGPARAASPDGVCNSTLCPAAGSARATFPMAGNGGGSAAVGATSDASPDGVCNCPVL